MAVGENSNEMESVQADEVREIEKGAGKLQDVGNCHKKVAKVDLKRCLHTDE